MSAQVLNKLLKFAFTLSLAGMMASLSSCTTSPRKDDRKGVFPGDRSHLLKGQEAVDYKEIQTLFNRGSYEALLPKAAGYERKYPKGAQLSHVYNFHGLAYLLTRKPIDAITYFKKSIDTAPHPVFREYVMYNLAAAQFDAGLTEDAAVTANQIRYETFDRDTRVKFHTLRGRLYLKQARSVDAARETLAASRLVDAAIVRNAYAPQLDQSLQGISDLAALEGLYRENEDSPLADLLMFRLGSLEIGQGKIGSGEARLKRIISDFPDSTRMAEAKQLLTASENQHLVDSMAVGVLLPLRGKFAKFGQRTLQSINLAFRIFNQNEPESKVTLVVQDAGEDPESALKGLNELFFRHHVVAVVGPMLSKGIDQVTQRAQELGLPILTLAQQPGVNGEYVFSGGITAKVQAEEMARYAIEKLGLQKFAIVYGKDRFGEEYSQAYWDAVTSMGGQIVGAESYRPGETDFRQVVDRLTGTHYQDARQRELDELAKMRETDSITKRTRKTEHYFALKPIIDFQAVFIPDDPKVVGQILPTFAYRDVEGVKFLGIGTWNSPELLARAQGHAEGALFVDAFSTQSDRPAVHDFIARFRATFESDPGNIEANAYDIASLLAQILDNSGPLSRQELRGRLANVSGFPGITGSISYKNGTFARNLTVLTIKGNQFVAVK
jgi:branched-chain amino acid transport system substrate-binding protein